MKQTSSPQGKVRKVPRHARSWLAHERGSGCSEGGTKERPTTAQGRNVEVGDGGVGTRSALARGVAERSAAVVVCARHTVFWGAFAFVSTPLRPPFTDDH